MARASTAIPARRYRRKADKHREDILGLRSVGMSYEAIAKALWWFQGAALTAAQVAYALGVWGEPPRQSMVRR